MTLTEYTITTDIQKLKIAISMLQELDRASGVDLTEIIQQLSKSLEEISGRIRISGK